MRPTFLSTLAITFTLLASPSLSQQFPPDTGLNPPGSFPANPGFGAQPSFGGQPGLGALPGVGAQQGTLPGLGDLGLAPISSEPPALTGSLGLLSEVTTSTEGTTGSGSFAESFVFLFRDDPEMGIVREPYTQDEYKEQFEKELGRLAATRAEPRDGPDGNAAPTQGQVADRATVEWDFYFEQIQMYDEYIKKKVLPGIEDLPGPTYDSGGFLSGVLTERAQLRDEFTKASVTLQTKLTQENALFYERLDLREDLRRNYLEWLEEKKDEIVAWGNAWQSNIEAQNFRAGNPVNRDSWYAKANYGNPNPMALQAAGRTIVVTKNPVETGEGVLNVVSGNPTPYDLYDSFGRPRQASQQGERFAPNPGILLLESPN